LTLEFVTEKEVEEAGPSTPLKDASLRMTVYLHKEILLFCDGVRDGAGGQIALDGGKGLAG
jgi:hypothetical protein